ncbi:MAG TPA: hypothetical protein VMU34_03920 [Mycobacterium sp.]|nr:hypothetical protein [Mycobacterium sp.]
MVVPAGLLSGGVTANAATVCPAIGGDTDCGVVITINDAGAQVSVTGQGPYDGADDTLVGVVNNSKRPLRSLILSSSSDIFGFDGDGLTSYGGAGNASDSTGYGGPNANFSAINAGMTSGTVNFVTPIPVGGSTYFGLENSVANAISCEDAVNGSVTQSATGPNVSATFTPNKGLTIAQAAQLCGFQNFDWVQKVTSLPDPSPFFARNLNGAFNSKVKGAVRITSHDTPFSDPPQGGGYTYQGNTPDNSYPFYYDVATELPGQQTSTTMSFGDRPADPCLPGGPSANKAKCLNKVAPDGSAVSFVTHLAGVNSDGSATDLGIGFTWNSNYSGVAGQVSLKSPAAPAANGTGTGGVTITSVTPDTTYQYDGLTVTGLNGTTAGPAATMLVYSGAPALASGQLGTLSARLSTTTSVPIEGRKVTLTLGLGTGARHCSAVTRATGLASCKVKVAGRLGAVNVTAQFAGDSTYAAAATAAKVVVFAYAKAGAYVVGDISAGTMLPGGQVTFWSDKWAQQNKLSGGPAPASFHGFEYTDPMPVCNDHDQWRAQPASSQAAPPRSIPAYTVVIVASKARLTKRGIVGNEVAYLIVATNPKVKGTGTIVASLC